MVALTNDERVRVATGQFETNKQAKELYAKLLKETKDEIKSLASKDTAEAKARITQLERTVSFVENAEKKIGTVKGIAGGLLTGATELAALPLDLVASVTGQPSFSKRALEEVSTAGIPTRPATKEQEVPFGAARGAVQIPLRTPFGTAVQSGAYALAGGVDETGMATGILGAGQLIQGLYQVTRAGLTAKQTRDLVKNLPENDQNTLATFMLRGQSGSDPQTAALIQRLKNNPATAEILNVLEDAAKRKTLSGMAPIATEGKIGEPIFNAVRQKLGALQYNITGKPIQDKFNRAKDVLGGAPSISIDETIKRMDDLIGEFRNVGTDSAIAAASALERSKGRMMTEFNGQMLPLTTVEKIQGNLSSFGKASGEENVFKDVARSDQQRIAAVVFGGLKQDLALGAKSANTDVRKASLYLGQARDSVEKGYTNYNNFVAQGLPEKLKNVNFNQLDDASFSDLFKGLSTDQRNKILPFIEAQAPEAVDRLRLSYYNKFLEGSTKKLDDGTFGIDFEKLTTKYNTLKPEERDILAFSLDTNAKEFSQRMDDATKFFRYNMKIRSVPEEGAPLSGEAIAKGQAVVGAGLGYQAAKGADVALRLFNDMASNLKDTDVLRILLTPEGKDFLKTAKMSPAGQETIKKLETLRARDIKLPDAALNLKRSFETLTAGGEENPNITLPEQTFSPVPLPDEEEKKQRYEPIPLPGQ